MSSSSPLPSDSHSAAPRRGFRAWRERLGWSGIATLLGLVVLARVMAQRFFVDGDSDDLVGCADGLMTCLSQGRLSHCPEAGKWPLLQYVPVMAVRLVGGSMRDAGRGLSFMSLVSFFALMLVTWRTLAPRSRPVATAAVLVLGSGIFVHYATRSFGEMQAAFMAAAFAASWLSRWRPRWVGLLGLLTGLTKETAFPFLGLLGLTCMVVHREPGMSWRALLRAERGRLVSAVVGVSLSVFLSALFNLSRFGKPYNVRYLEEAAWAPPLSVQGEHLMALWVAPNAGLLFFWPLFIAMLVALVVAVARRGRRAGTPRPSWLPLVGAVALMAMTCVLLARWWAPFGWWAWGARLVLPWLPAALLVMLYAYAPQAESFVLPLVATPLRTGLVALVLVAAVMPHVVSIYRSNEMMHFLFVERGVCPVPDRPETYAPTWQCIRAQAWTHPSVLGYAYRMAVQSDLPVRALLYPVMLAVGAWWLRRSTLLSATGR